VPEGQASVRVLSAWYFSRVAAEELMLPKAFLKTSGAPDIASPQRANLLA
jgi:hypothetical protein